MLKRDRGACGTLVEAGGPPSAPLPFNSTPPRPAPARPPLALWHPATVSTVVCLPTCLPCLPAIRTELSRAELMRYVTPTRCKQGTAPPQRPRLVVVVVVVVATRLTFHFPRPRSASRSGKTSLRATLSTLPTARRRAAGDVPRSVTITTSACTTLRRCVRDPTRLGE